jgi:uncharacterized protein YjiK
VLSQESGKIVETDRAGNVLSSLSFKADAGGLSVANQGNEGITMDNHGVIYVVNENGGGDSNHPQLWVYAIAAVPEPSGYALALGGFGLLAGVARRKRRAAP